MSARKILEGNNDPVRCRVMAPPGGKTSINLFGGYGEDPVEAPKPREAAPVAVAAPTHEPFQR